MLRCLAQLRKPIAFVLTRLNYSLLLILSTVALTMAQENALKVIKANNDLTTKLYAEINKPNENVFFSPLSIHTVLSLAYQGTKDKTENAFREVLGLEDKLKTADGYESIMSKLNHIENVTLEIANRVYVKDGYKLQPAFKDVAEKNFFAGAEPLDFAQSAAAAKSINDWVEQRTQNKIKDLISADDLNALTRLVLVNAIYFKGDWEHKFEETATTTEPFYTSETDSVDCRMMHKTRKYDYKEVPELDAKVLRIPYKNKDLSLVVVLPNKRTGITDLESKLSTFDLHKITEDMDYLEVELSLPKFKVETTMELNEPLKKMGLAQAFSDEADFSAMLESPEPLKISKVIQKAFIEVNEEGAEAAAATGMLMVAKCAMFQLEQLNFNADHPFVYYLSHEDNALFHGKLVQPADL